MEQESDLKEIMTPPEDIKVEESEPVQENELSKQTIEPEFDKSLESIYDSWEGEEVEW